MILINFSGWHFHFQMRVSQCSTIMILLCVLLLLPTHSINTDSFESELSPSSSTDTLDVPMSDVGSLDHSLEDRSVSSASMDDVDIAQHEAFDQAMASTDSNEFIEALTPVCWVDENGRRPRVDAKALLEKYWKLKAASSGIADSNVAELPRNNNLALRRLCQSLVVGAAALLWCMMCSLWKLDSAPTFNGN